MSSCRQGQEATLGPAWVLNESLEQRMDRFMRWSFGVTRTAAGIVVAAVKLLA